jgi:hypothetical protein
MSTVSLTSALAAQRDIGRSRVFHAVTAAGGSTATKWDTANELYLKWTCDTEGAVVHEPNMVIDRLKAVELTAEAPLSARVKGEAPTITIPAIYADPATRALLSPTGSASGGYSAARPVTELTMVIFAEELFYNAATLEHDLVLDPNGGNWLLDATAYASWTTRQKNLFGLTCWAWRVFPIKAPFRFTDENHGLSVEPVTIELMVDQTMPEGHMLYTIGDPYLASTPIDIEGGS